MSLIVSRFITPFGLFEVQHDKQRIHLASFLLAAPSDPIDYDGCRLDKPIELASGPDSDFCQKIALEIQHYFKNPNYRFHLPLKPQGSHFQQRVWNDLLVIPSGRVLTYGELANRLQSSPRAVGQACKKNPLALFIPCHRVVGKTHLGGYMGKQEALTYKRALLKHEGIL